MSVLLYPVIFFLGACLGSQWNRGIYRLAWYRRAIGPWSAPHPDAPPRRTSDRIPILGWWGLRRESPIHGKWFWVRPMLIELAAATGCTALYIVAVERAGLIPAVARPSISTELLYAQYLAHVLLISLMAVATFIDFDEQTIPDAITLPGTLAGLILMTVWPATAPHILGTSHHLTPLLLTSPQAWPGWLNGTEGLWIGLGCFVGWCLAIWPKITTLRRGWIKGIQFLLVSMLRTPFFKQMTAVTLIGSAGISAVWYCWPSSWPSLLTSLVGVAFGGGLIWAVRIVGSTALGKEAMGFGDVTLMAMIGSFLGWQSTLIIFFLAPFVAVFISLAQWMITRRRDIAFGPYLCVAALITILYWSPIWEERARNIFSLGPMIPQLLFFCLMMLAGLLGLWRVIERVLFGSRAETP